MTGDPTKHTAIIDHPVAQWEKLLWDVDTFQTIQRRAEDKQLVAYAAINVCISAWSLQEWTTQFVRRQEGNARPPDAIRGEIMANVEAQTICDAVANTAKHSGFGERKWLGGEVVLTFVAGDQYDPGGWTLFHKGSTDILPAYASFDALVTSWWQQLVAFGLGVGPQPTPLWFRAKMERIFPPIEPGEIRLVDGIRYA